MKTFIFLLLSAIFSSSVSIYGQDSTYTNILGIEFILINPGKMVVGKFQPTVNRGNDFGGGGTRQTTNNNSITSRPNLPKLPESDYQLAEIMANEDARPGFEVKIEKAFYLGKYEVTQAQWKRIMGTNPSYFQGNRVLDNADLHPVENVRWIDAQRFIKKLNSMDLFHKYRLPTEFEWEYASRSGADDDIPWSEINKSAVIAKKTTSEVGTKKPNAWGLYDTLGNVWEWVQDVYNEKIFADPKPTKKGKEHVIKGAPFYGDVKNATFMTHAGGPGSGYDVGFRIVMELK